MTCCHTYFVAVAHFNVNCFFHQDTVQYQQLFELFSVLPEKCNNTLQFRKHFGFQLSTHRLQSVVCTWIWLWNTLKYDFTGCFLKAIDTLIVWSHMLLTEGLTLTKAGQTWYSWPEKLNDMRSSVMATLQSSAVLREGQIILKIHRVSSWTVCFALHSFSSTL